MKSASSTEKADKREKLERKVLQTTMKRYREHRRLYGPLFVRQGHSDATVEMIEACRKLWEAQHGK